MPAPAFHDLSFEFDNKPIHFTITQHSNNDLVVFSNIGRIGQIVEVIFPDPIVTELQRRRNLKRVEYESKQILGPDNELNDLFIRRLVISLAQGNKRKSLLVSIGFDGLSEDHIVAAMSKLETYLQPTQIPL
ncbi:unnamed protein product [Auanema sp. JU1783]|nr:unnamed protein product [Auanema sp. JU1783]